MFEEDNSVESEMNNANDQGPIVEPIEESQTPEPSMKDEGEQKFAELERQLEEVQAELKKKQNDFVRAAADFENFRKRTLKEKEDLAKYGQEGFFRDLLPVIDSLHQAEVATATPEEIVDGMKLVQKQLWDVFEKHGLQQIEAEGKAFDPELHQAIARDESEEVTEELVHTEFTKGYQLHDRLLRASMVKVVVPKND